MLKCFFAMSLITLEVGSLFSCSTTGGEPNKVVFDSEYRYYDETSNQYISLELNENFVYDMPEDLVVNYPDFYETYNFKKVVILGETHKFEVDYWYVNGNDSTVKVEFPYTINEDTDITVSYDKIKAYSYSVVFRAVWKKVY